MFDAGDKTVGQIGKRVKQNGHEQDGKPAFFIAKYPPYDTPDEHASHLHAQDKIPGVEQGCGVGQAKLGEAGILYDAEKYEVVNVNEVTKRGDNDNDIEQTVRFFEFHTHCIQLKPEFTYQR